MKALVKSLALLSLFAVPPAANADEGANHVHRVFDIMRQGSRIGTDVLDIARNGDTTSVRTTTHIVVKIAFITAYRYDHSATETWKGNQLVAFHSTTNDNGTNHQIVASQSGGKIALNVDDESAAAPKSIAPASLWCANVSKHAQLFDTSDGKRMAVQAEDLGTETLPVDGAPRQVQHVKLSGQLERDLWFDDAGLVKMTLVGSDNSIVTSQLRQSTAER